MILSTVFVLLLASQLVIGFSADSGSRAVSDKVTTRKVNEERFLHPLGIIALWKLRPLFKTFNGYGSFGGTFGATFGGGGLYNGFSPFPGIYGAAGAGAGGLGVGGVGYPGVYPGGVHPIGYPYPAIGGPGPFNIRGNKPLDKRPSKITDVEDEGRLDVIDDESVTTVKPGFIQSVVEFTSPFFHAGQRIESRGSQSRYIDKSTIGSSIRRN